MKKFFSFFLFAVFLSVPFGVLASDSVDITLIDQPMNGSPKVLVMINGKENAFDNITIPIKVSSDVSILDVSTGTIVCDSFDYQENGDTVLISCDFTSPTKVNGTLGEISFSSNVDNYSFTLLDNNELEIGGLTLGEVDNIGEEEIVVTNENDLHDTEEDFSMIEQDPFLANQEVIDPEETDKEPMVANKYLLYFLIGGGAILLISIVGIVLSKGNKGKKNKNVGEDIGSTQFTTESQTPLKEMVNQEENFTEVNIAQEDIASPTSSESPVTSPIAESNSFSPANEEEDLEAILNSDFNNELQEMQTEPTGPTQVDSTPQSIGQESPIIQPMQQPPFETTTPPMGQPTVTEQPTPPVEQPFVDTSVPTQQSTVSTFDSTMPAEQPTPPVGQPFIDTSIPTQQQDTVSTFDSTMPAEQPTPPVGQPFIDTSIPTQQQDTVSTFDSTMPAEQQPPFQTTTPPQQPTNEEPTPTNTPPFATDLNLGTTQEETPTTPFM